MRASCLIRLWLLTVCSGLMPGTGLTVRIAQADPSFDQPVSADITNVRQIRLLAAQIPKTSYSIRLEGDVWWANPSLGKFVLKDDSGAAELEMDLHGESLESGQRVILEGNGTVTPTGAGFRIGVMGPVVDNDGVHAMVEKSGAVFLKAGRNPLRVEWFNGIAEYGLKVEYEGPALPRRIIPDSALFRVQMDQANGVSNWVNGLDFKCSAAPAEVLPDFNSSPVFKTGTVTNFDLSVMTRPEHVGICFTGFLDVPREGLYTFYTTSDDGSRLFVGEPSLQLRVMGQATFPKPQPLLIGQTLRRGEDGQWAEVEGKVTFVSEKPDGLDVELSTETSRIHVEVANGSGLSPALLLNHRIRATGFCQSAYAGDGREVLGVLLVPGSREIALLEPPSAMAEGTVTNTGKLPLLLTAAEVHRLKREEAQLGYPVKIRGVITSVLPAHQAFTIQDSTRGIYVIDFSESRSDPPRIGEFLEVEGNTDPSLFAPVVNASRVHNLGVGVLPEPVRPTWDQLMNGSLDAQYVEIQCILSSVQPDGVILLTSGGRIKCDLRVAGLDTQDFERYEDALIRVRGCLYATWDYVTHRVNAGEIRIYGAGITVDQPAPVDLFSTPGKTASELLQFDPQASVFQRVKVSGQIIHVRESEYFMMDGNNGVRVITRHPADLSVGDFVDAVGFPEFSVASPVLHEAVARKTGHAALPKATLLASDDLIRADLDSTRVRVKAVLVDQRNSPAEQVLEMRAGLRSFLARLPGADENVRNIPAGSQLELTGTYAGQNVGPDITSFELLLDSPSDITVLARPPWWTLEKLLVILGMLACVLAATVLWITQLRRKVEQRTAELEIQIRERQRVEQRQAMEQERARIAQDLHDELGSGLTEITMLGALTRASTPLKTLGSHLEQMSDKARQMVAALDEIVWAMNPTHDSLASMVSYFSLYAERFLGLANIAWRLERPFRTDDHAVDSRHRHQLFLAFKEALTNIVRHSGATEVHLNIQVEQGQISLTIADNGRGWDQVGQTEGMDGVANMRTRLEKLGGRFEIFSKTGEGTIVRFDLPLH
ncbi:MAG: ATP-binding protein [Verrucomicrobiota bacterium]|jgi:signal transduction histidine kinase